MPGKILKPNQENIEQCAQLLRNGDVVGLPTETVYGLAGNAFNPEALRKIFSVKGRPLIDPLIVHFKDASSAKEHVTWHAGADQLAAAYWPGPLTIVLPKRSTIPDLATAGKPSVAIRIPTHPVFQSVLQALDFPLAAPSANPFGYVSPTRAEHVQKTLGPRIAAILDGDAANHGLESTIVDFRDPKRPMILRHGPITIEALEATLQQQVADATQTQNSPTEAQVAPGNLSQHYSPNTRLSLAPHGGLTEAFLQNSSYHENRAIVYQVKPQLCSQPNTYWLSEDGTLSTVAHNLFNLVQLLDHAQLEHIVIELAPDTELGRAINDRLRRAAAKF